MNIRVIGASRDMGMFLCIPTSQCKFLCATKVFQIKMAFEYALWVLVDVLYRKHTFLIH